MAVRKVAKIGDILSIPVADDLCATAQVLRKRNILYVVIFSGLNECGSISVQAVTPGAPALAGWTMDAKIYHGDWKIIGRCEPIPSAGLKKNYTVEHNGEIWVEDFDGKLLHPASKAEIESLFNRSSYSPVRLERAIRAYHKLEPWHSEFDDLLIR